MRVSPAIRRSAYPLSDCSSHGMPAFLLMFMYLSMLAEIFLVIMRALA